jgi:hypothetical protein
MATRFERLELTVSFVVFISLLFTVSYATQLDGSATTSADGSPQPSLAAQSSTPQQPLREGGDGKGTTNGKSNSETYLLHRLSNKQAQNYLERRSSLSAAMNGRTLALLEKPLE